eukprot:CAMPEP_0198286064 /NCGR_PEP_ID=MMETSP1449-20131203/5223_1 /TAXON_ID=420275 /ORGANISM="Attheya septentrionalis, Strain CCMP2084" /LENGTH=580 /DNA_ID=CAMNT_0043983683 /DNA_START=324 /DNA_END=2066 /DNA_ORIENTATION=+
MALLISNAVEAKEIEATSEWTLLGPNDTVPAGLHIRMDMTTGEKWAKTIDETDDDSDILAATAEILADGTVVQTESRRASSSSSSSQAVSLHATNSSPNEDDSSSTQSKKEYKHVDSYDYDSMYRTLSSLPEDEQERFGGLPALEAPTSPQLPAEQRAQFESRLKEIWDQRQAALKDMQERYLANLPKLIQKRIETLVDYLSNPAQHLEELLLSQTQYADAAKEQQQTSEQEEEEKEEGQDDLTGNVIAVLKDLEYYLSDVDMARDFHSMGGWPLLVSMLSDVVHLPSTTTPVEDGTTAKQATNDTEKSITTSISPEKRAMIDEIQTLAAWTIGTAVSNLDEFFPWATEDYSAAFRSITPTEEGTLPVTPISLLVDILRTDLELPSLSLEPVPAAKREKVLYALGSLLRGNRDGQLNFIMSDGPSVLGESLSHVAQDMRETIDPTSQEGMYHGGAKFASRALGLADDIITEVVDNPSEDETQQMVSKVVIQSFTDITWCDSALELLDHGQDDKLREMALRSILVMIPYCGISPDWDATKAVQVVEKARTQWIMQETNDMHYEYRDELLQLVKATLKTLGN